jgi:hypothetical protein
MRKIFAIYLLSGTPVPRQAALAMGLSDAAICQWPDELTENIEARVMFAHNKLRVSEQRKFKTAANAWLASQQVAEK